MNRLLAVADVLVFLSPHSERRFIDESSATVNRSVQIPHGVSVDSTPSTNPARARSQFGYDADDKLITEPGYISPRKGSHLFVPLAERLPEYEFLLAGGPESSENEQYTDRIVSNAPPNLQVTGELSNERFHAAFRATDLAVLPYREIGTSGITNRISQSGILNRCMAYGLPVLGSDYQYFRDLEAEWGCVHVVASNDIDSLASRIRELIENDQERETIAKAARTYANNHRFEHVTQRHIELYESISPKSQVDQTT